MSIVNTITLPQDVLDRVERVLAFHRDTRLSNESVRLHPHKLDAANKPYEFLALEGVPAISLPPASVDLPAPTLRLMERGSGARDAGRVSPPQDVKTLATWLHFANGIAARRRTVTGMQFVRTIASDGRCFPTELYVAAFAIDGLEPGLYHYSPAEGALRKLRDGIETLARLTRGRPDLMFLRNIPMAMLVSTVFCRSTWRFGKRGYRHAVHDAGYVIQNLVTVGTGLGAQTMTRMIFNDAATREVIGVADDGDFCAAEAVQALVAWVDHAHHPLDVPPRASGTAPASQALPPIARQPLAEEVTSYVSVLGVHQDCVAPGVAVREIRPPVTDLSPMPADVAVFRPPPALEPPPGAPLRTVLLMRATASALADRAVPRDSFMLLNRLAFRGGAFYPLHPDGPHVALVRPFWIIHAVSDMDPGVWYYHPVTDAWTLLHAGDFRREAGYLPLEQPVFRQCAATCILHCHLHHVMAIAGPDAYRLAHLESGIVTNRIALATESLGLGWAETGSFYDEEVRQFLGLKLTGWEPLNVIAVGARVSDGDARDAGEKGPPSATA